MEKKNVDARHEDYTRMAEVWRKCRDVSAGQRAIHQAGVLYLPRLSEQTDPEYEAYKSRATFYNATWRTIDGMRGMILRTAPVVECAPAVMDLLKAADSSATPLFLLMRKIVEDVLTVGRIGLLVDHTPVGEGKTLADVSGARPTLAIYCAESTINWQTRVEGSEKIFTAVILKEELEIQEGYKTECQQVYRVLELVDGVYQQTLYQIGKDGEEIVIEGPVVPLLAGRPLDRIPFFVVSVEADPFSVAEPPLVDLVYLNIAHYRTTADYEHGCHFSALPTPWIAGYRPQSTEGDSPEKFCIGSQTAWMFPDSETKIGFLEFTGSGLAAVANNLEAKERRMAVLGARMLETPKAGAEAAQTEIIRRGGEMSTLASISVAISHSMTLVLNKFSQWAGFTQEVLFKANTTFFATPLNPQELTALVASWQQGAISKQTLFDNLQRAEIVASESTYEEEETRIESEGPKGISAVKPFPVGNGKGGKPPPDGNLETEGDPAGN